MISASRSPRAFVLLCTALARPRALVGLREAEWSDLVPAARSAGILARLARLLEREGVFHDLPVRVANHLAGAVRAADANQRIILWELDRVERALRDCAVRPIALKGAGYALAGLTAAEGRVFSDLDLLVPRQDLEEVERLLAVGGWRSQDLDDYDQRYYRAWMHEIPPLRHRVREVEVDIHHNLLPLTGRVALDAGLLHASARPSASRRTLVLAPPDMVLHSAAHLFFGGEFERGLRDLSDVHLLLGEFTRTEPDFWTNLVDRSMQLGLARPLFYALRFCVRLFGTPVPDEVLVSLGARRPNALARVAMDWAVPLALVPDASDERQMRKGLARRLLWSRSHWLRMPPGMLAYHLVRKSWKRLAAPRGEQGGERPR